MAVTLSLTALPSEVRHQILAEAIWTPAVSPPDLHSIAHEERIRLREDWDIWVPINPPPQPVVLSLLQTCRTLRQDVEHLLATNRKDCAYEMDIVFIPKCGLFPTWTCCPLPDQCSFRTIHASFRIMDVDDIDNEVPTDKPFQQKYPGVSSDFDAEDSYPNPPQGSWNFYRLLASFLSLGPRGVTSPKYQATKKGSLSTPRVTIRHLNISATSKQKTELDEEKAAGKGIMRFMIDSNPDLPYGASGEDLIFPGPPPDSPYAWTGPTDLADVRGMYLGAGRRTLGDADRLGLYLSNSLWSLLDFKWLSRGFGLMLYESILDDISFCVDGEPRPRFDMDGLLARQPNRDRTSTPEIAADLQRWKGWVIKWRGKLREGAVLGEARPSVSFVRYLPSIGASNALDSESEVDSEGSDSDA
ncbi:hypothetical protein QBC41DRAFT_144255 [Cercophora samala]|uniref:Uncharacterized protein n=1 Tax=Cercophora samala TaxID=330535 RepID=A0AA39ZLB7_9PEZI|nr:hypothetical protein QBC41DRAFT_144255 [Cercophora samala]